ncbi:hypothetical protein AOLI_G00075210 [Acnodon oligacanthus]
MICKLKIFVFAAAFFSLNFEVCFCKCSRSKYDNDGECCAKCEPGSHVHKHCTENSDTSCAPCPPSTFTAEQNGLTECTKCTVCDPGQGLRVKTPCTRSSDAVCEPLDGHYCTDEQNDGCVRAEEHKKCRPGQYTKHKGTSSKDTECDECEDGTYSDGSFQTCKPHSKCEDDGRKEIKKGTHSSDTECKSNIPVGLIVGVTVSIFVVLVVVLVVVIVVIVKYCRKRRKTGSLEDSVPPAQSKAVNVLFWQEIKWNIQQFIIKVSKGDVEKMPE